MQEDTQHVQMSKRLSQPEMEGPVRASQSLGPLRAQSSLSAQRAPLPPDSKPLEAPGPSPCPSTVLVGWRSPGTEAGPPQQPSFQAKAGPRGAETLRPFVAVRHAGSSQESQHNGPLSCLPHPGSPWQPPGLGAGGWAPSAQLCHRPVSPSMGVAFITLPSQTSLSLESLFLPSHPVHAAMATSAPSRCPAATGFSSGPGTPCSCLPRGQDDTGLTFCVGWPQAFHSGLGHLAGTSWPGPHGSHLAGDQRLQAWPHCPAVHRCP